MLRSKMLSRVAAAALLAALVAGGASRAHADDQEATASVAELQDRMDQMEQMMRSMQAMMGPMQQMMGQMQQMMGTMQQMMGRGMGAGAAGGMSPGAAARGGADLDIEGNSITMRRRHWGGMGAGPMGGPDDDATRALRRSIMAMHREMPRRLSGDPDRDFAAVMIPHHQGAVDMARLELQYGKDEDLKKLAEAVIKAQTDEIALLKAWLAKNPGK